MPPRFTATRFAAPRGGAFCLGAARRQKMPPRFTATRFAAPRGGVFALGRPGGKKPPRCAARGLLPPEEAFLPWERPGGKKILPGIAAREEVWASIPLAGLQPDYRPTESAISLYSSI